MAGTIRDSTARATLEAAGGFFQSILSDDFLAIDPGGDSKELLTRKFTVPLTAGQTPLDLGTLVVQ
jgi:hypothetical protein